MLYFPIEKGDVANAFNDLIYIVHLYVVQYNVIIVGVVLFTYYIQTRCNLHLKIIFEY